MASFLVFASVVTVDAAPIHWAAVHDDLAAVQKQLQKNVNVDLVDHDGNTALICAAREGHAEIVNALIAAGARGKCCYR